ncbi:MAG: DegV family protein [Tissierellia bacterium]|nr:DegV family protein [Tissierellia bacterium]
MNYKIIVDSALDLPNHLWEALDIHYIPMNYEVDGVTKLYQPGINEEEKNDYYQALREKAESSTSLITPFIFEEVFREYLEKDMDILYLGFSSGISSTFDSSVVAMNSLKGEYPDRKIVVMDSLCASGGLGLLAKDVATNRQNGMSLEENIEFIEKEWQNYGHFFMVNDLMHLVRGGRLSAVAGIAGSALGMKPILTMDEFGKLRNFKKARGVKGGLKELTAVTVEYIKSQDEEVFIVHSGNEDLAMQLAETLKQAGLTGEMHPINVSPVIGAHVGPDFVSSFFRATDINCRRPEGLK